MNSNAKKKFFIIFKNGLLKKIKTKLFLIVNIIMLVIALLISFLPTIIDNLGGDFNKEYLIYYDMNDIEGHYEEDIEIGYLHLDAVFTEVINLLDEDNRYKVIENTEQLSITEYTHDDVIIVNFTVNESTLLLEVEVSSVSKLPSNLKTILNLAITNVNIYYSANIAGISIDELNRITSTPTITFTDTLELSSEEQEMLWDIVGVYTLTITVIIFFFIVTLVQKFSSQLQEEKSSRTLEVIYSSVGAKTHLFARIISDIVFSIIQMSLLAIYSIIGIKLLQLTSEGSSFSITISEYKDYFPILIKGIIITSFLLISTILVILMSYSMLVSKTKDQEELVKRTEPLMFILVIPLFLGLNIYNFTGSNFIELVSLLPVFSIFLISPLYMLGEIGIVHVILSFVLLIITIIVLIFWINKSYKGNMLGYNTKIKR